MEITPIRTTVRVNIVPPSSFQLRNRLPVRTMLGRAAILIAVLCAAVPVRAKDLERYPDGLPKYLTPEERLLPIDGPTREAFTLRAPPTGTIHCPAEYEPQEGLFIAWEGYTSVLQAMAVGITTNDPEAIVYVVVDTTSEQTTVANTLTAAGANMSQVEFIVRTTDTVWIRDYGPRFIFEDGIRAIVDHTYNRPRPNDNAFNAYLGPLWGETVYDIPLSHGGGNFHLFANGDAFMTDLILAENPGLTAKSVKELYSEYQNVDLTIYPGFPTSFDSTQHIDMWMLPVGDNKVIIGQYASSTGQPYTITENAVADLTARGYTVYRTPGWNSGGTHYTYTNAVILNDLVFVPKFNVSQDATALAVFQAAMPGYTTIQVDCSSIITAAGAMHCVVMHVPAYVSPEPVVRLLSPNGGEIWNPDQPYDITWTARDDVGVAGVDLYYSTDGGLTYPDLIAADLPNTGSFTWTVPSIIAHHCRVRAVAHDADENTGQDDSDADFRIAPGGPQVVYSWDMNTNPGWTTQGLWAWGQPTGGGGAYGNPDPASGYTGLNVYGYNLNGDYTNSMPETHLTSTAIDCTGLSTVSLAFWRWLGVERSMYDHAYVRVSNNGTTWTTIWQNPDEDVTDSTWIRQEFDISAIADNQPTVYLRWTMGTTDSAWTYCGWNIDDVEIRATTPAAGDGDCDGDGNVDLVDFAAFQRCYSGPDAEWIPAACAPADTDGDGDVDHADAGLFTTLLTGP